MSAVRLILAIAVTAGLAGQAEAQSTGPIVAHKADAVTAFDGAMRRWLAANGVARGSLAVMRNDRLVMATGYGGRSADDRIGIWSLSKVITAVCVATLAQEQRLRLTDRIGPLLAPLTESLGPFADARVGTVSVEQLILHRGGYARVVGGNRFAPGIAEALRQHPTNGTTAMHLLPSVRELRLVRDPGSGYEYSNVGYLLLGQIIEAVTGKSYEVACHERVLAPAGIRSPMLEPRWGKLLQSSAGWAMSGPEYLAFARLLRPRQTAVLNSGMHAWLRLVEGRWIDASRLRAYTLGLNVRVISGAAPNLYHSGGWSWHQADARDGPISERHWTWFLLANDGVAWFASFSGKDGDDENRLFDTLDAALWTARRNSTSWPAHDLFQDRGIGSIGRAR